MRWPTVEEVGNPCEQPVYEAYGTNDKMQKEREGRWRFASFIGLMALIEGFKTYKSLVSAKSDQNSALNITSLLDVVETESKDMMQSMAGIKFL